MFWKKADHGGGVSALGVRDEMDPKPDSVSGYQEAGWGIRPAMILNRNLPKGMHIELHEIDFV